MTRADPPLAARMPGLLATVVFCAVAAASVVPWPMGHVSAIALFAGMALGLLRCNPWPDQTKKLARFLMQACIVLLGLRLDLHELTRAASDGIVLSIATIVGALGGGLVLARLFGVARDIGLLLSVGTAICGGSAIASVGSAIRAKASDIAIATATVFTLNAIAVLVFPFLGRALNLHGHAFGTWAGVAVHDMASVPSVARDYQMMMGDRAAGAVDTANVVKLTRVLWIMPITLVAAWWYAKLAPREGDAPQNAGKIQLPWFIALFVLASALRTFVPVVSETTTQVKLISAGGFQLALFLTGAGVSIGALRAMGWRAFTHAVVLWVCLAGATLLAVRSME
jgi:uncharacterized integral membrane protein (TIGR00698 family)